MAVGQDSLYDSQGGFLMKQPKLYKLYFEYRHEVQPKDAVFACICRAEQVEKIVKYYEELWWEIVERQLD